MAKNDTEILSYRETKAGSIYTEIFYLTSVMDKPRGASLSQAQPSFFSVGGSGN
jgi:hypothetical protein